MLKFATAEILSAHPSTDARGMVRTAHRADFSHHPVRPGYLYVRSRAISSRCNDNWDEFPAEEISKAYRTFIGKPVFVNHVNHDTDRARGVIIDAALHRDKNPDGTPDTWVEVLMEVDGVNFPKLARAILAGEVDRTSMGCDVDYSICSACGNKATNPAEYCKHIPAMKGKSLRRVGANGKNESVLIRETCFPPGTPILMDDGTNRPIEAIAAGDRVIDHLGQPRLVTETMSRLVSEDLIALTRYGWPRPLRMTANHPVLVYRTVLAGHKDGMRAKLDTGTEAPVFMAAQDIQVGDWVAEVVPSTAQTLTKIRVADWERHWTTRRPRVQLDTSRDRYYTPDRAWGGRQHILRPCHSCGTEMDLYPSETRRMFCSSTCWGDGVRGDTEHGGSTPKTELPDTIDLNYRFGRWCGWMLSEGSIHKGPNANGHGICFGLHSDEDDAAAEIISLARDLFGLDAHIERHKTHKSQVVVVHSAPLARFMRALGDTVYVKALPEAWMEASTDFLQGVLTAHNEGDGEHGGGMTGGVKDPGVMTHATSSPLLWEQLYRMHLMLGHTPTTKNPDMPGGASKRTVPGYHIRSRTTDDRDAHGRLAYGPWVFNRIQKIEREPYSGTVHNLAVADTHTYVADGIAVHNCYGLRFFENSLLVEPPADPTAHLLGVDATGLGKTAALLPEGLRFHFLPASDSYGSHLLKASLPGGIEAGHLEWDADGGTINMIKTDPGHRGLGIADAMWRRAHEIAAEHDIAAPRHSPVVLPDGAAWRADLDSRTGPLPMPGEHPLFDRPGHDATEMRQHPTLDASDLASHLDEHHGMNTKGLSPDALRSWHDAQHDNPAYMTKFHHHAAADGGRRRNCLRCGAPDAPVGRYDTGLRFDTPQVYPVCSDCAAKRQWFTGQVHNLHDDLTARGHSMRWHTRPDGPHGFVSIGTCSACAGSRRFHENGTSTSTHGPQEDLSGPRCPAEAQIQTDGRDITESIGAPCPGCHTPMNREQQTHGCVFCGQGHHSYCCPTLDKTARYSDTGPKCSHCHHVPGTGPGCPKCQATKTLKQAIGDLDLDGEGHTMVWQYRDAGPTVHGTCRNCGRTTELGAPGMRGDNTSAPSAHSGPCPAIPDSHRPDTADRLTHAVDYLPEPRLPQHLNARHTNKTSTVQHIAGPGFTTAEEWDEIHPTLGDIHRGVAIHLHPRDHAIVHDASRPTRERAHHLLESLSRSLQGRNGEDGIGRHWTTDPYIAESFAREEAHSPIDGHHPTEVIFHARAPHRDDIDDDPEQGEDRVYAYDAHDEEEVPLRHGTTVTLKGISWRNRGHAYDENGRLDDGSNDEYTHHDFGGRGHRMHATLTAAPRQPKTASDDDGRQLPEPRLPQHLNTRTAGYDMYGEWDGYGDPDDEDSEEEQAERAHEREWDDIHEGMGDIHRGIGVFLHPDDHAIVHDKTRPVAERIHHLLDALPRSQHGRHWAGGHLGTHWTTEPYVAEDFAEKATNGGDGRPGTAVVFHAHKPDRDAIDHHPSYYEGDVYGYHDHGEREVPLHSGAGVSLRGISFRDTSEKDDADGATVEVDPEYTHHDFGGHGHHVHATLTARIASGGYADNYTTCAQGHQHWDPDRRGGGGILIIHHGPKGPRVLLGQRADWVDQPGTWGIPGGAIGEDETPVEAAIREAGEELGGHLPALRHIHTHHDDHGGWRYSTVIAETDHRFRPTGADGETDRFGWFRPDQLGHLDLHPGFAASWPHLAPYVHGDPHTAAKTSAHAYDRCPHCGEPSHTGYCTHGHVRTTDWSAVPHFDEIHRGFPVLLGAEDHAVVHDTSRPAAERGARLLGILADHSYNLGSHWTTDPRFARESAQDGWGNDLSSGYVEDEQPEDTHLVLHAAFPDLEHIEDDIANLQAGMVFGWNHRTPGDYPAEHEVPLKHDAPVYITGVSFKRAGGGRWTHVPFQTGMRHVAAHLAALRTQAMAPRHGNPAEHPFFVAHPVNAANVVAHWIQASDEEKAQGMRWYADAHLVAKALADTYADGDVGKAAGVISAYSPRSSWAANLHNAARSLAGGRALDKGEGVSIMGMHHNAAKKIMEGEHYNTVLKAPKTNAFAALIHHGGTDPDTGKPMPQVVIDRHALSVAAGKRLTEDDAAGFPSSTWHYYDHVAKTYQDAAAAISGVEGHTVAPHQLQAITWLTRIRLNRADDLANKGGAGKGRARMQDNTLKRWKEVHPDLLPGGAGQDNMHMGARRRLSGMEHTAGDGDYRFYHTAPDATGVPLHRLLHPSSNQTLRSLENGRPSDEETGAAIEAANGRPRARIKIYRAVPSHITTINTGDWIALSSRFARDFAEQRKDHHVIATSADARHIHTDGNDALEWGYNGPAVTGRIHWKPRPRGAYSPDYAGGAVALSPADHEFIHDPSQSRAERAHRLISAIPRYDTDKGPYVAAAMHQNKGSFTGNQQHADYDADEMAEQLAGEHPGAPLTRFLLHSPMNSQAITGISWAAHTPGGEYPDRGWRDYTEHRFNAADIDEETGMRRQAAAGPGPEEEGPGAELGKHLWQGFLDAAGFADTEHYRVHRQNNDALSLRNRFADEDAGEHGQDADGEPYYQIRHPHGWLGRTYNGPRLHISHESDPEAEIDCPMIDGANTDPWDTSKSPLPEGFKHHHLHKELHEWAMLSGPDYAREYGYEHPEGHDTPSERQQGRMQDLWDKHHRDTGGRFDYDESGEPFFETAHHPMTGYTARDNGRHVEIGHAATPEEVHEIPDGPGGEALYKTRDLATPGLYRVRDEWSDAHANAHTRDSGDRDIVRWRQHRERNASLHTAYGETKAPAQVDTLREDACPVCDNSEGWDGVSCPVCQFVTPPSIFMDPDTSVARTMDLRGTGDAAAQTALQQGVDEVPGGLDQASQIPGGDATGQVPGGAEQTSGGVMEDPTDATAIGDVRTLGDGGADPAGMTDATGPAPEQPMSPAQMPPGADLLTCPACGFQTPAGPPVSTVTDNPALPASAGPVAGDVCPNCGKAILVSQAEAAGLTPPPAVPADDPQLDAEVAAETGEQEGGAEKQEEPEEDEQPGGDKKPKSPAVKRVSSAQRMDSVKNLLSYKPTDFDTWEEVHDNFHWDHPKMRDFIEDIRRNGVQKPVMVDYENDPPTVEDGHTRILAAHKAGLTHVPVRQGNSFDFYLEDLKEHRGD